MGEPPFQRDRSVFTAVHGRSLGAENPSGARRLVRAPDAMPMAVGLVPTYESIGTWGTILLTIVRLIRGIGVGGEWGGSVLLAMEWARTNKNRGLLAASPQFGGPAGLFLANLAVLFFSWLSGRPADPRILALALQCVEARVRSGLATGGRRIRTFGSSTVPPPFSRRPSGLPMTV